VNLDSNLPKLSPREMRELQKTFEEMKANAMEDPIFFFNTFLKIYNPKQTPSEIPFATYPYQNRLIRQVLKAIEDGEDIFIDKTREMGVSYVICGLFLWLWLSRPGFSAILGSRKEEYVDNRRGRVVGNKDMSLFGKIDYMLTRLPPFMIPDTFRRDRHFTYMSLTNPENGNTLSGESSNASFSRGGRATCILLDEFAFWDNAYGVWGATADTTRCRIVVTTPGEKPSKAKRLRFGLDGEKIKIIEVPFSLHPEKSKKKWLEAEKERRGEEDFNREIMMDWGLSIKGRIYPELERAKYGKYPYIKGEPLYCSGDYGLDGTVFGFWQINPKNNRLRLIDCFFYEDEPIEYSFPIFGQPIDTVYNYTKDHLKAIEELKDLPHAIHFGDPSIIKRSGNADKESDRDKLAKIGVHVNIYTKKNTIDYRVKTTKTYFNRGIEVNEGERTYVMLDMMKQYRWKTWDEDHETSATFRKPVHNLSSHFATSAEYLCVNLENYVSEVRETPDWAKTSRFITNKSMLVNRSYK
jgi:hypothetical protein